MHVKRRKAGGKKKEIVTTFINKFLNALHTRNQFDMYSFVSQS